MDMLSHCFMSIRYMRHLPCLPGVDLPTDQNHNIISNYTPEKCSAIILYIGTGVVVVAQGWWYMYGYTIPLFYELYTGHGPHMMVMNHHTDHYMTSNYTQDMLSCIPGVQNQELWPCTSISGVVVQWWWYIYWYTFPLSYKCYMIHVSYLPGVDRLTDPSIIPCMLICFTGFWNPEIGP